MRSILNLEIAFVCEGCESWHVDVPLCRGLRQGIVDRQPNVNRDVLHMETGEKIMSSHVGSYAEFREALAQTRLIGNETKALYRHNI